MCSGSKHLVCLLTQRWARTLCIATRLPQFLYNQGSAGEDDESDFKVDGRILGDTCETSSVGTRELLQGATYESLDFTYFSIYIYIHVPEVCKL